jgi:endonuclease
MPIYDKPVRLLFYDMVSALGIEKGDILTREAGYRWFHEHYGKIKDGTLAAHFIRMSTNAPSRPYYSASPEDDLLFQIDAQHFRRYDPTTDPPPIYTLPDDRERGSDSEEDEVDGRTSNAFAYERDLQNYLAQNLHLIEPGMTLYEEEGITGLEFPTGSRRIDILALDQDQNLVVIELKVSRGYAQAVGQILRYIGWIRQNQAYEGQEVRGIIIAREITEDLKLACSEVPQVALYEYQLSVSVQKI